MGRRATVSIKTVMKKYKLPDNLPAVGAPIAIIAGKVEKKYEKNTDQGTVPYFRGIFWGKNLITNEELTGEVCSLPPGASDAVMMALLSAQRKVSGQSVEFAFMFEPAPHRRYVIVPLIEPRNDDVAARLRGEVMGLIEMQAALAKNTPAPFGVGESPESGDSAPAAAPAGSAKKRSASAG